MKLDDILMTEQEGEYGVGKDFNNIKFVLFSNQCMFSFVSRIYDQGKRYECFFDLLKNEDVYLSDYREYERSTFEWLAEQNILTIGEDGLLKLGDVRKIIIVQDLFKNDVISYWHYHQRYYPVFQEWIEKGYLETESRLFSRPEADYYNFILNDTDFDNGRKIRNKYIHGNEGGITDEETHKKNYMIFLKLFIILIIKINDELCLNEQLEQMNQEG